MTEALVPRHVPGVVLRQGPGTAELVEPGTGAVVALDPLALALWEMCDGETTAAEMTAASCALFDADEETVEADITRVLTSLQEQGLLEWVAAPHPITGSRR